ncbi:hypothetical protein SLA2020_366300 [Shorea laevis]
MRTVVVLVAIGLLLLCFQGDAKRFILEEVTEGKSGGVDSSPTDVKPVTGLTPTAVANDESNTSNKDNNKSKDETNESYGSFGNPSGSSAANQHAHYYTDDCQPGKYCPKKDGKN